MKTFVKYMKIAFSIFIVFLLGAIAYFVVINQEGLDRTYFSWLEKDVQKSDSYQYGFHIMTVEKETGDLRIMDKGLITVDKSEKTAKIVVKKSEYEYFDNYSGESLSESHKLTYYIEIIEDTVYLYVPDPPYHAVSTYSVKIYDQPDLAEAVSAILFSDDIAFLDGDFVDLIFQKDRPHMTPNFVVRSSVDATGFYEPFQIIRGEENAVENMDIDFDRFAITNMGSGATVSDDDESIFSQFLILNQFTITLNNTQDLYAYAYETLTGQVYDNGLDGVDCEQMMVINFYSDRHDAEPFNLPNIK